MGVNGLMTANQYCRYYTFCA